MISEQFIEQYKDTFNTGLNQVTGFKNSNDKHAYVQTLLNRLLFIKFLSLKNCIDFKGDNNYLDALWDDYQNNESENNFYNNRLVHLFFNGLGNQENVANNLVGNIFYVGGDLFDKNILDNHKNMVVHDFLPYTVIKKLLNNFNFSLDESELDHSITPQILEKVFEELLLNRSETGAYYTSPDVVAFMCNEALKRYLFNNSNENYYDLELFINEENHSNIKDKNKISILLDNVTMIDPACGSGAYVLGMVQSLSRIKRIINNYSNYESKFHTIQNNIYGTDINKSAISITKSRLWLSLLNDYEEEYFTLPNIDFNIISGDSLCGMNPKPNIQMDLFAPAIDVSGLAKLKHEYVATNNYDEKKILREKISNKHDDLRKTLGDSNVKNAIEWKVDFAEVFDRGGFDVVLANPPYVSSAEIGDNKNNIVDRYKSIVPANSDLYVYFYIRGLEILKNNGIQIFICSNSWMYTEYGVDLTKHILNNAYLENIYESSVEKQFASAEINTIISIVQKIKNNKDTKLITLNSDFETSINNEWARSEKIIKRNDLLNNNKFGKYISSSSIIEHIEKIYSNKLVKLNQVCDLHTGITDNNNIIDKLKITHLTENICPIVKNIKGMNNINIDIDSIETYFVEKTVDGIMSPAFNQIDTAESYVKSRMAINCFISTTARTLLSPIPIYFGNVFNVFYNISVDIYKLCAIMNSSYFQLYANIYGQKSMGGGLLQLKINDLKQINVVNINLISDIDIKMFDSFDWDVRTMSQERINLDNLVFDALNLNISERDQVYEDLFMLVNNRVKKSQTVLV